MENILKKKESLLLKYFRYYFSEKLSVKSAQHYYIPIFPWIWDKLSRKKSALVRSKILGLFVSILVQTLTQQVISFLKNEFENIFDESLLA